MNKDFRFHRERGGYADASVVVDRYYRIAGACCSPGAEADLALCLAALVHAGALDIEKLRAALVLADPVAREKVAGL